jgi:hypothetical protein
VYDASLLLPAGPDAGPDAAPDAADAGEDGFSLAHWPPRPAKDDGTDELEGVIAVRTLSLEDPDAGPPLGYDLDGVQTCPDPGSCKPLGNKERCDGLLGRDNSGGSLIREIGTFSPDFSTAKLNQRLSQGEYSALVRIVGYNGTANDTKVGIAFYVADGTDDGSSSVDGGPTDAGVTPPKWDGNDRWLVDSQSTLGGAGIVGTDCTAQIADCVPKYVDSNAYVADGMLVATLDIPLYFGVGGGLNLDLSGGKLVARITRSGTGFALDGQIVGRWPTSKLLPSLAPLNDPFGSGKLCGTNATYLNLKQLICAATDVMSDQAQDNKGSTCDSVSVAVAFTAAPAKMGRVALRPSVPQPCGANWTDKCP